MRLYQPFSIERFATHVTLAGGQIEPSTSEWEALRYRFGGRIRIIHRNKKERLTFCPLAERDKALFDDGEIALYVPRGKFCLFTDASLYHATKAGAWAAVLSDENLNHVAEKSGPLKGDVPNACEAELAAIANGLHIFIKSGKLPRHSSIKIITDSRHAIERIDRMRRGKYDHPATNCIRDLAKAHDIRISMEWIKGHQPEAAALIDKRVTFNRLCDSLCRSHGKKLHKERAA